MPHRQGHLLRGVGLMMLAVFMFSSMDTLAKHVLRSYPIPPLIWARYFIQSAFMVAVFGPRMGLGLVRTRHPVLQVVRGLLLVSSTVFFYLSLIYLPLAEAAAISFVGPVLVTALSGPLLKERVGPRQ
jgi:drug/metabolite transporter (DMT)-like permease